MQFLWRLLLVLGVNGVMLVGLGWGGWAGPTALAVYWFENLVGSVLIAIRIAAHRWLTRKRGHFRSQLGVKVATGEGKGGKEREIRSFIAEFVIGSLVFTLAHGFFLGVFVYGIIKSAPDPQGLWMGALGVGAFQLAGFVTDLFGIKERPFAWIKRIAQVGLGRIVLIHLAILGGAFVAFATGKGTAFFLPFAGLKLLVEIASVFGQERRIERAPSWLVRLMNQLKPGVDFAAYLAAENVKELAREAEDEEVLPK